MTSSDVMSEPSISAGARIGGKYLVERLLGRGGMGVVFAARHVDLGQGVAVKILRRSLTGDPKVVARFLREARAAARIDSPHVARVFDSGTLDSGEPYMVMELLEGEDLSAVLRARGRLPAHEAVRIVRVAIEGIAAAHALGIVHRDLKPANLFLVHCKEGPPAVKVLDFGISKVERSLQAAAEEDLTATTAILGSPRYIAPEQVTSAKTVDARADVWALGVILYQALSGRTPFTGATVGEILGQVLMCKPPSLAKLRPPVAAGLITVVERCLERDIDRRWPNARDLSRALAPYERPESIVGQQAQDADEPAPTSRSGREAQTVDLGTESAVQVQVPGTTGTSAARRAFVPIGIAVVLASAVGALVVARARPDAILGAAAAPAAEREPVPSAAPPRDQPAVIPTAEPVVTSAAAVPGVLPTASATSSVVPRPTAPVPVKRPAVAPLPRATASAGKPQSERELLRSSD